MERTGLLTIEEASYKVAGLFNEYLYETTVLKTDKSKDFGCFKNTDKTQVKITNRVYCRNANDFNKLLAKWNNEAKRTNDFYSYHFLTYSEIQKTASEIVAKIYRDSKLRQLAYYEFEQGIEYIQ